ncbi:MAG: hypothetical protein ACPL3C_07205 [Pyrobaculum sp.]
MKVGSYRVKLPEGWNCDVNSLPGGAPDRGLSPDIELRCVSRCGELSFVIEVTGVPEIRDVEKTSTSAGVRIVHHGGGVGGEVLRYARRMGVLLVNCSVSGLLDLEAVLRHYLPSIYNKCI